MSAATMAQPAKSSNDIFGSITPLVQAGAELATALSPLWTKNTAQQQTVIPYYMPTYVGGVPEPMAQTGTGNVNSGFVIDNTTLLIIGGIAIAAVLFWK